MTGLSVEARQLAGAAGDYINVHGWTRGKFQNLEGSVCMAGAVEQCLTVKGTYAELSDHLRDVLGAPAMTVWNDAEERTQGEVVAVLYAVEEGWL